MREGCGCAALDELDEDPDLDREARAARKLFAEDLQRQWGCTAAGLTPPERLTRGQEQDLDDFQRVTRCKQRPRTCPFAQTRRVSLWLVEVTRAVRVMERTKGAITFREMCGRSPHLWDVRAIDTLLAVQDAVSASDDKAREREREAREAELKARGEQGRR